MLARLGLSLFVLVLVEETFGVKSCAPKQFPRASSQACVCNATYCDEFPPLPALTSGQVAVYTTSQAGKRYDLTTTSLSSNSDNGGTFMREDNPF